MKLRRTVIVAPFAFGLFVFATPAYCGTANWTGTTSGTWSVPSNWGGTAPSPGDELVFNVATNTASMTNDFAASTAFDSLTLNTGEDVSLSGNPIDLGAGGITQLVPPPSTIGLTQSTISPR